MRSRWPCITSGNGHLWVDVFRDQGGQPGEILCTTQMVALRRFPVGGYRWETFAFQIGSGRSCRRGITDRPRLFREAGRQLVLHVRQTVGPFTGPAIKHFREGVERRAQL